MRRRLERIQAKQVDVVREIVSRQDYLLEKLKVGTAGCPIDFQIVLKEGLVISNPASLPRLFQTRSISNQPHVLVEESVKGRLQQVQTCRAGDRDGRVGSLRNLKKSGFIVRVIRVWCIDVIGGSPASILLLMLLNVAVVLA